jgi:Rrf2 family protein
VKITAQEEYGLRCLLQLARHPIGEPITLAAIAEAEGLSIPYVAKLMNVLRGGGLVESVRGRSGGYSLARSAEQLTVGEVLIVLGGPLFTADFCDEHHGTLEACAHADRCSIRTLWGVVGGLIDQVLQRTTLADLVQHNVACGAPAAVAHEPANLRNRMAASLDGTQRAVGRVPLALTTQGKTE